MSLESQIKEYLSGPDLNNPPPPPVSDTPIAPHGLKEALKHGSPAMKRARERLDRIKQKEVQNKVRQKQAQRRKAYLEKIQEQFDAGFLTNVGKRRCTQCGIVRPETDDFFRRTPKRGLSDVCRPCMKNSRRRKILEEARRDITQTAKKIVKTNIKAPHISELCEQMFVKFGGLNSFVEEWKRLYDEIVSGGENVKLAHDMLYGIVKLTGMSTEHRSSAPDVAMMTDDDLERELQTQLRVIHQQDADQQKSA